MLIHTGPKYLELGFSPRFLLHQHFSRRWSSAFSRLRQANGSRFANLDWRKSPWTSRVKLWWWADEDDATEKHGLGCDQTPNSTGWWRPVRVASLDGCSSEKGDRGAMKRIQVHPLVALWSFFFLCFKAPPAPSWPLTERFHAVGVLFLMLLFLFPRDLGLRFLHPRELTRKGEWFERMQVWRLQGNAPLWYWNWNPSDHLVSNSP